MRLIDALELVRDIDKTRGERMNHDATHCLDYRKNCPKDCYRAQLTEELKHRKDLYYLPISWAHFGETEECLKKKRGGENVND